MKPDISPRRAMDRRSFLHHAVAASAVVPLASAAPASQAGPLRISVLSYSFRGLLKEGKKSLKVFLKMCAEDGVNPRRKFSGRFNLRISPDLHERITALASASGQSINTWMIEALDHEARQQSD